MSNPDLSLDIPATWRQGYDPESPMRNPEFWAGAIKGRDEHETAAKARLLSIQIALEAHTPLDAIPEYRLWLAHENTA